MMSRRNGRFAGHLAGIGTAVLAIVLLEVLSRSGMINPFILPAPSEIAGTFGSEILHEVPYSFLVTVAETFAAASIAVVLGMPIGWLFYSYDFVRRMNEPLIAAMASAPLILLYPLFLVAFGRSITTVVLISALAGTPPIILKTSDGLRQVRRVLVNVGRSFSLTRWQIFRKIELPAAAPTIFTGIRLGLMIALINIVAIEFLINIGGLGRLVSDLADAYEIPAMYAAMLFVLVVSALFFLATEKLERWFRPV